MSDNRWRVYFKPFDDFGNYTDWVDVTDDVSLTSFGDIQQSLDNTDYDIGIYRTGSVQLRMMNLSGKYSDVGNLMSMFKYTRSNTLCKITWSMDETPALGGTAIAGYHHAFDPGTSDEFAIFTGLLNDDALTMDLKSQQVVFAVLGRESVLDQAVVPGTVAAGDLISAFIYKCLNQTQVSKVVGVDVSKIAVGTDVTIDDVTDLLNRSVSDALNDLLLLSNSILKVEDDYLVIAPRTPTIDVKQTFYGQASVLGPENVTDIQNIRTGLNRTFNYFSWKDNSTPVSDGVSISKYGLRAKAAFDYTYFTDPTKQAALMTGLLNEFSTPKQEFEILTPLTYDTAALNLLDRIAIDYPIPYVRSNFPLSICGQAICGEAKLPTGLWSFKLDTTSNFKPIGKNISIKNKMLTFNVRAI